jgi:hypothetical protein
MADERPPIPDPIKREVRQRCGFGCVLCGLPLYEYEHILGYTKERGHVAEEITLLCDRHHREKTGRLLPVEKVIEADKNPYNLCQDVSPPYGLHFSAGESCVVRMGENTFTGIAGDQPSVIVPLMVDGQPLIRFELMQGHLLLGLRLFDEFNNLVLRIENNELVYRPIPWDIELVGRNLIVREASRKILVDLEFRVPNELVVKRARFLCNGVEMLVGENYVLQSDVQQTDLFRGCSLTSGPGQSTVGFALGPVPEPRTGLIGFHYPNVSRYSGRSRPRLSEWLNRAFPQPPEPVS